MGRHNNTPRKRKILKLRKNIFENKTFYTAERLDEKLGSKKKRPRRRK